MKSKWPEMLGVAFLVLFFVSGCALMDSFFGIRTNPDGTITQGPSPSGAVGGIVGTWFPWATAILSGAGNVYLEIRRRNWKGAAVSTVTGLEEFFATPEGAAIKAKLVERLKGKHDEAHVQKLIEAVLSGKPPI